MLVARIPLMGSSGDLSYMVILVDFYEAHQETSIYRNSWVGECAYAPESSPAVGGLYFRDCALQKWYLMHRNLRGWSDCIFVNAFSKRSVYAPEPPLVAGLISGNAFSKKDYLYPPEPPLVLNITLICKKVVYVCK